jgi:hypothetical protein
MPKSETRIFKVEYKGLVREIKKTLKSLEKIEKKVSGKQKKAIALQIKSLSYLEGVCSSSSVGVSPRNIPPKMSGCNMVLAKMSKIYTNT